MRKHKGNNSIRVCEFEKLYYHEEGPFTEKHWTALAKYQERQQAAGLAGREFFRLLNKGIQFTNYVGVIQAGTLTIEILPKTDRHQTTAVNMTTEELQAHQQTEAAAKQKWHNVLLQMLRECRLLDIHDAQHANLQLRSNSILEIYLDRFITETQQLVRAGLIRKYVRQEANLYAMKGRLLFAQHLSHNLVHQERFYTSHTTYDRDNLFNQLLYKTLVFIEQFTPSPEIASRARTLLMDFPELPDCRADANTFDRLIFDRKTVRYAPALLISRMLLLNYRPDLSGGAQHVLAILFDMNMLWEEFVFRRLKRSADPGTTVSRQNKKRFWYNEAMDFHKIVKPDIVVTKGDRTIIIDTKWKIIDDNRPSDNDLKQMFVYNLLWDAEKSLLLYPGIQKGCTGSYPHFPLSESRRKSDEEKFYNDCSLAFINVVDEAGLLVSAEPFKALLESL